MNGLVVVDFDLRRIGAHMPRSRYRRGTLSTRVRAHSGHPERKLPRGQYWCMWYRYVRLPDGRERRQQREKIITKELAESHRIATEYSGPLTKAGASWICSLPRTVAGTLLRT